ncbi:unnamed protein product [Rodentolepis nana]|uniref:Filamin/ABP280 repeat protein n=1 Tax=Rodentolepis nana TaxID=102285 RepID=A0A3P7SZ04_RODNA|nr:unnamed protein product [Rodentolepis nana]
MTEPRENAFLRYEDDPHVASDAPARSDPSTATSNNPQPGSAGFVDIARCLAAFGRITVSTTYPPLCTANLPGEMHVHLPAKVLVQAYDYHGERQTTGKDPISVHFKDSNGREASSLLVDNGDGSYEITLCPVSAGPHTLAVNILSRPIRGSPYVINVRGRQKPQWSIVDECA